MSKNFSTEEPAPKSSTKKQVHVYGVVILFFVVVLGVVTSTLFYIYKDDQTENVNAVNSAFSKEVEKMRESMSKKIDNSTKIIVDTVINQGEQTRQEISSFRAEFSSFKANFKTDVIKAVDSCLNKAKAKKPTTKKITARPSSLATSTNFVTQQEFRRTVDTLNNRISGMEIVYARTALAFDSIMAKVGRLGTSQINNPTNIQPARGLSIDPIGEPRTEVPSSSRRHAY
jgi:hypothetical protein